MVRSKIGYKLILVVGIVNAIAIAIFLIVIIKPQCDGLIAQAELGAYQLSETIKSSVRYDMLNNHRDDVHRIIDTIGRQNGIVQVRIFNKEGGIIYSSDHDEIDKTVDMDAEACYACHTAEQPLESLTIEERSRVFEADDGFRNLGVINPIYNETGCWQAACHAHNETQIILGVLDVTVNLEAADRMVRANQIRIVIITILMITFLSLVIGFFVRKLIGDPVYQLLHATNLVASGDMMHRIKINSKDELGNLAQSFNLMIENLSKARQHIYQQDKLASLGRLAAGVAHEINNPLTGVLTYSSFLLKRTKDHPKIQEDLRVIVRETKRCREIVKGLLDFARQAPSKKTKVNINKIILHSLLIIDNQLSIDHVTVKKELADDLPLIRADANQMQQVMINLIVNASDAIETKKGDIYIATIKEDKQIKIVLSDTGCGISQEKLTTIFEPFYSTKGQKGTGLGLAVVWGIIEKHKGKITVDSVIGKGTTFTIVLPIEKKS
ncbi:MAG: hypothetical protein B6244_07705 [Candidatus Cloacimonetes bacterium 4572_55]|nr:MAG: hypothetical protein B6244_07705 [Candidatus Cloacimonetes bacterium 4572_55]